MTDLTSTDVSSARPMALDLQQAWQVVLGQLRQQMARVDYETWISPLVPVEYTDGNFTLGAQNDYTRQWAETRLSATAARILQGVYGRTVSVKVVNLVDLLFSQPAAEPAARAAAEPAPERAQAGDALEDGGAPAAQPREHAAHPSAAQPASPRKVMLQRAYGSKRAAVIQPERAIFMTFYFFQNWTPLVGHSAAAVINAARMMCYWNPKTGELRNVIETEMGELAQRASVSLRTIKDVLKNELVQRYFLRYRVRRVMTSNGVRTAGIVLQVRMDDPLTPEDQAAHCLPEEERWYSPEFALEGEDEQ